jgi:hypothetical protein
MTLKKTIMTGALILGATVGLTTATFAQSYGGRYDRPGYSYGGSGYEYNRGPSVPDTERGGPGPRVGAGSGAGIGAER